MCKIVKLPYREVGLIVVQVGLRSKRLAVEGFLFVIASCRSPIQTTRLCEQEFKNKHVLSRLSASPAGNFRGTKPQLCSRYFFFSGYCTHAAIGIYEGSSKSFRTFIFSRETVRAGGVVIGRV